MIVVTSLISKLIRSWRDRLNSKVQRKKVLRKRMQDAPSYAEWKSLAREVEVLDGHDPRDSHIRWRKETKLYDRKLLQDKLAHLRKVRSAGDVKDMMFALRTDLIRNVGNIASRCAESACAHKLRWLGSCTNARSCRWPASSYAGHLQRAAAAVLGCC